MLQTPAIVWTAFLATALSLATVAAPSMHQGRITAVGKGEVMVLDSKDGESETFAVGADTKITVDAKPAKLIDLQVGFTAEITAEQNTDGKFTAKTIAASSKISPQR